MPQNVLILQGHPDAGAGHLCHALADSYAQGAQEAGHDVRRIDIGTLDFPLLRSQKQWEAGALPPALQPAQEDIRWASHVVIVFPLWLGDMPALVKGFLEQVLRPGFAFRYKEGGTAWPEKGLRGRTARVIVTMGMPPLVYRWMFRAHSVKSLERNILGFVGIAPVHETLVGGLGGLGEEGARKLLARVRRLGARAE
ncbi:NAD(P)H-dependent oxidoreductase [Ramlibacter sp. Leaf400]|uniref:NAD(P)H-dependent oxidoreductase n=1 Tax=Ramlibacter sp. Leaf400 TaxID=1736365 RepID=UPI0006F284B1|nr:NAD(P)H-dependent oxidoreductase [Ramlibacter sp. Leaf400]KQT10872.1 dehydrogenase [Ramlibacter sp. Leaf400]